MKQSEKLARRIVTITGPYSKDLELYAESSGPRRGKIVLELPTDLLSIQWDNGLYHQLKERPLPAGTHLFESLWIPSGSTKLNISYYASIDDHTELKKVVADDNFCCDLWDQAHTNGYIILRPSNQGNAIAIIKITDNKLAEVGIYYSQHHVVKRYR